MDTVCFINDCYGFGRQPKLWISAEADVFIGNPNSDHDGLRGQCKAKNVSIGTRAYDIHGIYLGRCVEHIKNDPDADTFAMDSREMIEVIRDLRDIIEHAGIGEKVR